MMNRGTQLFLIGLDGQPIGPFGWPLIREWASLSLLNPSAVVFVEGGADWEPLANHPELLTTDEAGKGCVRQWLESHPRRGQPATDEEMRHLETLGCPVDLSSGDSAMCERVISQLTEHLPERTDLSMKSYLETRKKQREEERRFRHAGYHHAPTPKQIQRLQSMGIPIESGLTEDRAAALIDPPTEEQIQRLTFHRIAISPYLTEKDAQKLIDSYRRENPESEAAYRAWTATA